MNDFRQFNRSKLAVGLFLFSETGFFLLLIIAYVLFRMQERGANQAAALNPATASIFTLCLIASSFTMIAADRALLRGHRSQLSFWLLVTLALGLVFIFGQGHEWAGLIERGTTVSSGTFGSSFFTLTGFHGLHLMVGLLAIATLSALALGGQLEGRTSAAVGAVGLYWHFVDVVWIAIFAIIYLWSTR